MIRFETEEMKFLDRKKLVIRSTHQTLGGVMANMFSNDNSGNPMLSVDDAIELRGKLDSFIQNQLKT